MPERFPRQEKIEVAKKDSLTAFITLVLLSLLGSVIFNFFRIILEAIPIMGGILFFRNGMRMLDSKIECTRTTLALQEESEESDDIAISPIGIPLIAGPDVITAARFLSTQTPHLYSYFTLIFSFFFVLSFVYIIRRNGDSLLKLLGNICKIIIQRLMGLILIVIAVQL